MRVVRLGQGVDATGAFAPDALERTRRRWPTTPTCYASPVPAVRMVATSATRDAANRDDFFAMTSEVLGAVVPGAVAEVITGDEEAELSFAGAVGELDPAAGTFRGGRSRRRVHRGGARRRATWRPSCSADIGCVRITERCLHSDPPTAERDRAPRARSCGEGLGEALRVVPVERARTWVGVAGTMTTLSALAQR